MPRLIVTKRDGAEVVIDGQAGLSVMEVIRGSGSEELLALCGGSCSCGTCHVYVDPGDAGKLARAGAAERELLGCSTHLKSTSRLSCQIPFQAELDGLRVTIAPED